MLKPLIAGLAAFVASAAAMAIAQDGPPPGGGFGARALMRADANGDGVVTRDEYMADAARRFDRMDLNHDGRIDQAEMQQMGPRGRGPGGPGRRGQGVGMGGDMPPPPPPAGTPPQQ